MRTRTSNVLALLASLVFLVGCRGETVVTSEDNSQANDEVVHPDMIEPNADPSEDPNLLTGARGLRRMDLDQLDATVRQVTGGIGWDEEDKGEVTNLLEEYSDTLGKPDYIVSVDEDLAASAIFSKFVGDMARDVCLRLMERERNETNAGARTFLVHVGPEDTLADSEAEIRENLAYLLLRFHGATVTAESGSIDRWQQLFSEISSATGDPMDGWNGVCVALIRHPDFYTY